MYEEYLKEFASQTTVSYETWKKVVEIIDDVEIYIDGFDPDSYFTFLYAFYEESLKQDKHIMEVMDEYADAMRGTLGYQCKKAGEEAEELFTQLEEEFKKIWKQLAWWQKIIITIKTWLGGKK